MTTLAPQPPTSARCRPNNRLLGCLLMVCALMSSGCAAISNPAAGGIPARRIPAEFLAQSKEDLKNVPLTALGQPQPDNYRLAAGDTLGVYIEGILGEKGQPLPVQFRATEQKGLPPAIGYPIPVREDGTLPLPYIKPLFVSGMTLKEAEEAVYKAYIVDTQILVAGRERILITLMKPREFKILVFRQETPQSQLGFGIQSSSRRGIGERLELPAYENDVLNAIVRTGGTPGLDALNEVTIQRHVKNEGTRVIRIPLRIREGEEIPFKASDVILATGDVVFIEARDTELYYIGGLSLPKQFPLPRDYDLRITDAIGIAGGPLINGGVNTNNLSGSVIANGLGSPSPSQVTVIRRTKNYGQIKIHVSINRAINDPRENIIIMSGDTLILQETPGEAFTRYVSTTFRFNFFNRFIQGNNTIGTATYSGP